MTSIKSAAPHTTKSLQQLGRVTSYEPVISARVARRALDAFSALPPDDASRFEKLVGACPSPTGAAFLWKALAAGHDVRQVEAFDATLTRKSLYLYDEELIETASGLADASASDGMDDVDSGVTQQLNWACGVEVRQVLETAADPVLSVDVRLANANVNAVDDAAPERINPLLARYELEKLAQFGGSGGPRTTMTGSGLEPYGSGLYDECRSKTGLRFKCMAAASLTSSSDRTALVSQLVRQLRDGILTPVDIGNGDYTMGHGIAFDRIRGPDGEESLRYHDSWKGETDWVSRKSLEDGSFQIAGHSLIWGLGEAVEDVSRSG